uniref:Trichodiene oxygenase n=1 Tax=Talaromyces marneffei PM1 TaxID=1077442 RepID=A0A093UXV6_TALMA
MALLRQVVGYRIADFIGGAGNIGFGLLILLPQGLLRHIIGWSPRDGRSIFHLQQKLSELVIDPLTSPNGVSEGRMLSSIYASEHVPLAAKTKHSLLPDTLGVVLAGTEATANVLITVMYYLLSRPESLQRLQTELRKQLPTDHHTIEFQQLKRLPYLDATILEGFRLEQGSEFRTPRVSQEPLLYNDQLLIPAGRYYPENAQISCTIRYRTTFMFGDASGKSNHILHISDVT